MKFIFKRSTSKFSGLTTVDVSILNGSIDKVGTLHLDIGEWEALRAILLDGVNIFQDDEAEIEIVEHDSMPAYLEGV
jgi:hypothetical protein